MTLLYSLCRGVTSSVLRTCFSLEVRGEHHVPLEGGLLIAANHLSFLDPPLVAVAIPREIHFLARKTLFAHRFVGPLIADLNSIPIDRDRPDMNGLRQVIRRCQDGKAVLIFPESTRSPHGQLQPGQAGVGLVAAKAGVPVLPVRIRGSYEALPRHGGLRYHPLSVTFGPIFSIESRREDKDAYQRAADQIMSRIAALD